MLVAFVGPPCSGKTTTAARLFADLKERGLPVEFLAEYARLYIALKRFHEGDAPAPLDDRDQVAIFMEQYKHENILSRDPTSLVIADSSAISALLYMNDDFIEAEALRPVNAYGHSNIIEQAKTAASRYDIVFRCSPVKPGVVYDPNRVHSYEQSVELDKRITKVFARVGLDPKKVFPLFGDTKMRVSEAGSIVMREQVERMRNAAILAAAALK
jgi:nicotinamide riboside kinase